MKKLLFWMILINHSFLNGMQSINAFMKCGLGLSYSCTPIAKIYGIKLDDIPLSVQGKIVKKMFLLTFHDNKCEYVCKCTDDDHNCLQCSMHRGEVSFCKKFRLECFDTKKLEKHILTTVPLRLGLQYIDEFLDIVHHHQTPILGEPFNFKEIYSIPCKQRKIVLATRSIWVFFSGYTQEEYRSLKEVAVLKGRMLSVVPETQQFIAWKRFHIMAIACACGGAPLSLLTMKISPTISRISFIISLLGGTACLVNAVLLKKYRKDNTDPWQLKKVIL